MHCRSPVNASTIAGVGRQRVRQPAWISAQVSKECVLALIPGMTLGCAPPGLATVGLGEAASVVDQIHADLDLAPGLHVSLARVRHWWPFGAGPRPAFRPVV
jgi:hypothetical protein